jgi:signal transduction histidine kinase
MHDETRDDPGGRPTPSAEAASRSEAHRARLRDVASALAWPIDPSAVSGRIIEAACATLGAPQGWLAVVAEDGRTVEILASRGFTADQVEPWRRVPLSLDVPMTIAIRKGVPLFHSSAAARIGEYPDLSSRSGAALAIEASAVVPLVFEGVIVGALAVTWTVPREFDADDRWFLESLATQGSGALERARLFDAVRDRDERLRLALGASGTWIWSWDLADNHVEWTPEPPFGSPLVRAGADAPEDWLATVHPDDLPAVQAAMEACIRDGGPYDVEFRLAGGEGPTRWLQGVGRLVRDAAGVPMRVIGTTRDITDRKTAELDRDRRLDAEREASRLRDAFIGVVSHELRTPITTIFGGTRVLARRWRDLDPDARDAILADISGEADRLYRLVEDILVITRVERGHLDVGDDPVSLRPILARVMATEGARRPDLSFEVAVPADLPSIQGEEAYLEQVLRNLVGNAAKYGRPGSLVQVTAEASGDDVVIRVLDDGPGIEEGDAEALFDLFYRSPSIASTVPGAGIGLFVCRRLVDAMGGRIRAERRPEGGAAFVVTLARYGDDGVA